MIQRLIGVIVTILILHAAIGIFFLLRNESNKTEHQEYVKETRYAWEAEDADRRREQERRLREEYGTNDIDRVAYDPKLSLPVSVRKLFEAVMPSEYDLEVRVHRFTEVEVFVNVYNMPQAPVLAGYLKEVFSRIDPDLVYMVIFTDGDRFRIVTNEMLTAVDDWQTADVEEIKRHCLP